jgi:hypothetical protein
MHEDATTNAITVRWAASPPVPGAPITHYGAPLSVHDSSFKAGRQRSFGNPTLGGASSGQAPVDNPDDASARARRHPAPVPEQRVRGRAGLSSPTPPSLSPHDYILIYTRLYIANLEQSHTKFTDNTLYSPTGRWLDGARDGGERARRRGRVDAHQSEQDAKLAQKLGQL